jgi:hypothetical protein
VEKREDISWVTMYKIDFVVNINKFNCAWTIGLAFLPAQDLPEPSHPGPGGILCTLLAHALLPRQRARQDEATTATSTASSFISAIIAPCCGDGIHGSYRTMKMELSR